MRHLFAAVSATALMLCATRGDAVTRTVTTTADSGVGSLRQTIADANASGDVIAFDAALADKTITLTGGALTIGKSLGISTDLRVTISGNRASRVFTISSGATVSIAGLTIRDGSSAAGAGIANAGTLTLTDVTVTENRSTSGGGGGIHNEGVLTAERTTISYNAAVGGPGGGIDNVLGGDVALKNSTVSGNVADGNGGGIDTTGAGSTLSLVFSTVAFNRSGAVAGGIFNGATGADVTLESTILWGNRAVTAAPNCSGTVTSSDYNLVGDAAGCTVAGVTTHNRSGDPLLGALQRNGGAVATHPLRPGSDAMDRVPSGSCASSGSHDARNVSRPRDGTATGSTSCDIGAYEAAKPIVVNSLDDFVTGNNCPLRYAITAADTNASFFGCTAGDPDADRITFAVTGVIRLTVGSALRPQQGNILIEGPGASLLTVSGEAQKEVFALGTGGGAHAVSGLTIANGNGSNGGGLDGFNTPATIAIDRVAFEDNVSKFDYGGSAAFIGVRGVEIEASSFRNTSASSPGASVKVTDSNVTIRSSTFGETRSDRAVEVEGTIFQTAPARLRLIGCTIRGSEAIGVQATTQDTPDMATLEIQGSVVAGHGADFGDGGATLVSRGDNVIGDGTGPALQTGDVNGALAQTKLASHLLGGGDTKTIAPLPGSAVIDRIPLNRCPGTLDQRGVPRPLDGDRSGTFECDSGAFETAPPIVVNSLLDTADVGKCRLRDAIVAAGVNELVNGCAAGLAEAPDLITFSVNGTITLGSELTVTDGVALRGPGATRLTISGAGASRVFNLAAERDLTLTGLTVANGSGVAGGGAALGAGAALAVSETVFRNNLASSGGAIYADGARAVQLDRSAFWNPASSGSGTKLVDLRNSSGEAEGSTFFDNGSSPAALGVTASGGGGAAFLRVKNSTVSAFGKGLQATSDNGASPANARIEYRGTIVSGGQGSFDLASGAGVSYGYNVSSDASGNLSEPGDQPSTNPQLGPLGYHGGTTPVFNLKLASPAKDAIPLAACGPAVDQRGFPRPFGPACDVGAVERRPGGDVNGDGNVNVSDVFYVINFLFAAGPVPVGEGDMNGDGAVDVSDVFYLINRLFAGGAPPV